MVENKTTPLSWKPPPGHKEGAGGSSSKRPFPLPARSLGMSFQNSRTAMWCEGRTAVRLVKVFFRSFEASMAPWSSAARALARLAQRSQEVLKPKGNATGMSSPHRGSKVSPDLGPNNRFDAHKHSEISGPRKGPPWAMAPVSCKAREMSRSQQRSAAQPASQSSPRNVKVSSKKQAGPANA